MKIHSQKKIILCKQSLNIKENPKHVLGYSIPNLCQQIINGYEYFVQVDLSSFPSVLKIADRNWYKKTPTNEKQFFSCIQGHAVLVARKITCSCKKMLRIKACIINFFLQRSIFGCVCKKNRLEFPYVIPACLLCAPLLCPLPSPQHPHPRSSDPLPSPQHPTRVSGTPEVMKRGPVTSSFVIVLMERFQASPNTGF